MTMNKAEAIKMLRNAIDCYVSVNSNARFRGLVAAFNATSHITPDAAVEAGGDLAGWFTHENGCWVATSSDDPCATKLYRPSPAIAPEASELPPNVDAALAEAETWMRTVFDCLSQGKQFPWNPLQCTAAMWQIRDARAAIAMHQSVSNRDRVEPVPTDEAQYLALRLKRVARAAGVEIYEKWSDEQVAECAVTILGEIARKLETTATKPAVPASEAVGVVDPWQLEWLAKRKGRTASCQLWALDSGVEGIPVYLAATAAPTDAKPRGQALAEFIEYVVKNYPPYTVIADPAWHAPRLFRAAELALKSSEGQQ